MIGGNRNIVKQYRPSSANNKRKETPQGQNKTGIDFNPGIRQMMGQSGGNNSKNIMAQRSGGLVGTKKTSNNKLKNNAYNEHVGVPIGQ